MEEFEDLLKIAETLHGPEGCPWDRKQTFESLRAYILEEAHEVLEAIDKENTQEMVEELGDLFYTVVFFAMIAEKKNRFSLKDVIKTLTTKLIRRHPHVFGEEKAQSIDEVVRTWEKVKKEEKKERQSALDGIPKTLPVLQRAQKILKRIHKHKEPQDPPASQSEEEKFANQILDIVRQANEKEIDLESAFRRVLNQQATHFQAWELQTFQD